MTEDFRELVFTSPFQPQRSHSTVPSLPAPGPTPAWSAAGVIGALEPLTTESRRKRLREVLDRRLHSVTVVLDDTHKAHNRSAIIRSCEAFGVQRAHFISPKKRHEKLALSKLISKGSHNWVDLVEHASARSVIDELRATGHQLLVTHPAGRLRPSDLERFSKVALVLGNEKHGVGSDISDEADDTVGIEMTGFVESLNVSVTAAILLQAATRGRNGDLDAMQKENIYARWLRNSVPRADEVLRSFSPC